MADDEEKLVEADPEDEELDVLDQLAGSEDAQQALSVVQEAGVEAVVDAVTADPVKGFQTILGTVVKLAMSGMGAASDYEDTVNLEGGDGGFQFTSGGAQDERFNAVAGQRAMSHRSPSNPAVNQFTPPGDGNAGVLSDVDKSVNKPLDPGYLRGDVIAGRTRIS